MSSGVLQVAHGNNFVLDLGLTISYDTSQHIMPSCTHAIHTHVHACTRTHTTESKLILLDVKQDISYPSCCKKLKDYFSKMNSVLTKTF